MWVSPGLYVDLYQLRMMQGYFLSKKHEVEATFDYFFRANPFGGGYVVTAGLQDVLSAITGELFDSADLSYLQENDFEAEFIEYLRTLRFTGSIFAVKEGDVVFPGTVVIKVVAPILQAQWVETLLLNIVNFQSLIATKSARMIDAAQGRDVIDFGMRRAQGLGSISASRAAVIGGCVGTSNVAAAEKYNIPAIGTMSHSWVQSFDCELDAFKMFADVYGSGTVLLVDTYDTLSSGVPNAIKVALYLQSRGLCLQGIRLDSGDLAYLSKSARAQLDQAGFPEVKIIVSNQLDEFLIDSLLRQEAPIDVFAVGTKLVTGDMSPALDGVYKLSEFDNTPRIKISNNTAKITLPGKKEMHRYSNHDGFFVADVISLQSEAEISVMTHPVYPMKKFNLDGLQSESLLHPVMQNGSVCVEVLSVAQIAKWSLSRRKFLGDEYRRVDNPHTYKVGVSSKLLSLRDEMLANAKAKA